MGQAKIIEIIKTDLEVRGDGKSDPYRIVTQYWNKKGTLLFEDDPNRDKKTESLLSRFQSFLKANHMINHPDAVNEFLTVEMHHADD